MKVVADSHTVVWFLTSSPRLSAPASAALDDAETSDGIVVSVASLIDLWYVTQTTQGVAAGDLHRVRQLLDASTAWSFYPVTEEVADVMTAIPRAALPDPWDRLIVATARHLGLPLVTRDAAISAAGVVQTIW